MEALKRKDTTKGPPLRILSLDGGGVRGYSIFIILQEVMHRTFVETEGRAPHRNEIPKPADHFDLIVGTGTGGLIALMLGRLRLDIETCKALYVRMTRLVFETDKTILGIPTRPTLFKASRLEDAIKEAVREHTVAADEGKDGAGGTAASSAAAATSSPPRRHASNASVVSFSARSPAAQMARPPLYGLRRGDPNAFLYDARENRTKTAVTAVYKGAPRGEDPVLLRSYDSRREPAPEFDCRIWEAGRATCAIGLAFKPIQIGQTVFHDDGSGTFNPAPHALDEAAVNEWPGRAVGVFLSVGTGKRSDAAAAAASSAMWYDELLSDFADARRRLVAKIEGCEAIHAAMLRDHLPRRGVPADAYVRLNVEVGVGEFGMNEWNRLAEISTGTKRYLHRPAERAMVQAAAAKLAKIHRAHVRAASAAAAAADDAAAGGLVSAAQKQPGPLPADEVFAVELPGDTPASFFSPSRDSPPLPPLPRQSYDSGSTDHLSVPRPPGSSHSRHDPSSGTPSPRSSSERFPAHPSSIAEAPDNASPARPPPPPPPPSGSGGTRPHAARTGHGDDDKFVVAAPTPEQWRQQQQQEEQQHHQQQHHQQSRYPAAFPQHPQRMEPPPLPPKTPLPDSGSSGWRRPTQPAPPPAPAPAPLGGPPYPVDDDEAPPPPVDKARKPAYRRR